MESDENFKGVFQYQLFCDFGRTGNFEVAIHSTNDRTDTAQKIWSKHESGKFPSSDWTGFKSKLSEVVGKTK